MKLRISCANVTQILIVIYIIGWSCDLTNGTTTLNVTEYMNDLLRQTKVTIAKYHVRELQPVVRKSYNILWQKLWSESIGTDRALTTILFDKVFVVKQNRIMAISLNKTSSNKTSKLKEVFITSQEQPIKFIRRTVWKSILYILICYESDYCSLYTGSSNFQLKHKQNFKYTNAVDAEFFTQANRLYLIVIDNVMQMSEFSTIYYWRGTYMDIVAEIMIADAVSVTTFNYKQSTIIVIAQNSDAYPRVYSVVYKFKDNDIEKIQFLSTDKSISVRHYRHEVNDFVILTNEIKSSIVYWWDGIELLKWLEIPEIQASDLTEIIYSDGDVLFFIARKNAVYLYKLRGMMNDCFMLDLKTLEENQQVVDMTAWADGIAITLVLITVSPDNLYRIELWKLSIKKDTHENLNVDEPVPDQCLADLKNLLQSRTSAVRTAENSWKFMLSSRENETLEESLIIPNLILESITIDNIDFSLIRNVSMPHKIQETLEQLDRQVGNVLAATELLLRPNGTNFLTGNVNVEGDAYFDELFVDNINITYVNDIDVRLNDVTDSRNDQLFFHSLQSDNISTHDLEIDSLCGIPFEYWSLKNDTRKISLSVVKENTEFSNDSIIVRSNLSMNSLTAIAFNHINIDDLFNELFIINHTQKITGNLHYTNRLQVVNLIATTLNGSSSKQLLTKNTDQSFDGFCANKMQINRLYADFINGVPVAKAARKSRKNIIKGPVILMNLKVTEELSVETNIDLLNIHPTQIYDDVVIRGDVKIKTINFLESSSFLLDNININFNKVFNSKWTKSTNQIIRNKISFERGITIDHLNANYTNGFKENEFLYTTSENIPEIFTNLHFDDFYVNASLEPTEENLSLFEVGPDSVTIRKGLHLQQLKVDHLFTNVYNGVPIDQILKSERKLKFNGSISFPAIRVNRAVIVDNLKLDFLNDKNISNHMENVIYVDEDHQVDSVTTTSLIADHLTIEKVNGFDIESVKLPQQIISVLNNLTIDGDLIVEGDLNVFRINDVEVEEYMNSLNVENRIISSKKTINTLIVDNLTAGSLYGLDFGEHDELNNQSFNLTNNKGIYEHSFDFGVLFNKSLSKSRPQTISAQFSSNKIVASDIETEFINNQKFSELMWIDQPLTFPGNVTFTTLYLMKDVVTDTLNGEDVNELHKSLRTISAKNINNLKVDGSVFWKNLVSGPSSLSYLFENAVTRNSDQTIHGNVTFAVDVYASMVSGDIDEANDIHKIVSDTVMSDEEIIQIKGRKVFKDNVVANIVNVAGDVGIRQINLIDIINFNASVFRKNSNESLSGTLTFVKGVKIDYLIENSNTSHSHLNGVALATDLLKNLYFEYLTVQNNIYLKKLDGIEFDSFIRNRITLTGNHEIFTDVLFNGPIKVKGLAKVDSINDIDTSQLVLNNTQENQVISSNITFVENLIVDGNVDAFLINGMNIKSIYSDGVFFDKDTEIFGDLTFESDVKILKNTTILGLINDMDLHDMVPEFDGAINRSLNSLQSKEIKIKNLITQSRQSIDNLVNAFFYLETDSKLKFYVKNVNKVIAMQIKHILNLKMYGEDPGSVCGLPEDCWCPFQHEVEFSERDYTIRRTNGTLEWNFRRRGEVFNINILTNLITSSEKCITANTVDEFITISWMKTDRTENGNVIGRSKNHSLKIQGYLKDVDVFPYEGKEYVILAIYYDALTSNHNTNSLIYELDFEKDKLKLFQTIPTDGAWTIEIFKILCNEIYVLIGCFGESAKTTLYKLSPKYPQMVELRSFLSKSRYVKYLWQENNHFVFLDEPLTRAVNIYYYDVKFDNFYTYQSFYYMSRVNGIESFYSAEYDDGDTFIIVTTEDGRLFIYEYMFAGKFQLKMQHWMDGIQTISSFNYMHHRYVFAGSNTNSTVFRIVHQGPF